ncbi:MAG: hypothetical protein AMXMBFR84_26560 [Candidatus Hydrogenedentota bacterium]
MSMVFKKDEIVILLGAGASVDAGIPHTCGMVNELERLLREDKDWQGFTNLYNYVKSAILFSDGMKGRSGGGFNIERLVVTLDDLQKGDEHPLFPFIGSWAPKLPEVAGSSLERLGDFRRLIVQRLRDEWVQLDYYENASYYGKLCGFQREYEHPLRIFTLNYDLCVEKACTEVAVERGFSEEKTWDWRVFDPSPDQTADIYLYKMHGSIDWERDDSGKVTFRDSVSRINVDNLEIIFGTTYKLQYVDPFLFFAYELRRWTLSTARLIITVGYGFADEHVNGILGQALKGDRERRLLAVIGPHAKADEELEKIGNLLSLSCKEQVKCSCMSAKEFFNSGLSIGELANEFPNTEPPFDEVSPTSEEEKE